MFWLELIVSLDCQVYQGSATITIEHLTWEVKPLEAKAGDRVPGGGRNLDGRMIVKATKAWNDSTLNRIVQLTKEAHSNKPKLQKWLDEFGETYSKDLLQGIGTYGGCITMCFGCCSIGLCLVHVQKRCTGS